MKKKSTLTIAFIFALVCTLAAQALAVDSVPQKDWLPQFQGLFASSLCEKKTFVTTCFNSSVSECKLAVREQLKPCAKNVGLPASITLGRESELWGEKMGGCLAPKLASKSGHKTGDAKCSNLSAW